MTKNVGVLNFNYGNINSVLRTLRVLDVSFKLVSSKNDLKNITHLIIPGVGSFKNFMEQLKKKKMIIPIKDFIKKKPVLAICLGMQILFTRSEEFGIQKGLNILNGVVKKIDAVNPNCITPNIGHLKVFGQSSKQLLKEISNKKYYFAHSYACVLNKSYDHLTFNYSKKKYIGAILHKNIIATQFHPELSRKNGLIIYKSFLNFKI
tara:strand:- start:603 stop:1220 length:618 start_codon:yes stop_codon:yes gene_type:complete